MDKDLFKKLDDSEIAWELRILLSVYVQAICFLKEILVVAT